MNPIYAVILNLILLAATLVACILHFIGRLPGDPMTTYIGSPIAIVCALAIYFRVKRNRPHPMTALIREQTREQQ